MPLFEWFLSTREFHGVIGPLVIRLVEFSMFEESAGTNTWDCTRYSLDIVLMQKWSSGMIVSNAEHLPRVVLQATQIFPPGIRLLYAASPAIKNREIAGRFCAHETEGIIYTLKKSGLRPKRF